MEKSSLNSSGFTLIEVLVALTIMALITGVAFTGLSIGIDSWRRGSQKIQELDRRLSVERLIQRQVSQADEQLFRGDPHGLEFISTYSLTNGSGDPVWVKYSFDSTKLLYREKPAAEYVPDSSNSLEQTLGQFSRIEFRYLATDALGDGVWQGQWREDDGLPVVVQVRIDEDIVTIPLVNQQQ